MINLVFRFDDPSPLTDHALERSVLEVLSQYRIPCTIAVTPFSRQGNDLIGLDAKNASHLLDAHQNGAIDIALHGYLHEVRSIDAFGRPSEFYGLPRVEQETMIINGRRHMETLFGITLAGFVPPFNSHDANTENILDEHGFQYISADWDVPSGKWSHLITIPRTCQIAQVRMAAEQALRISHLEPLIIVVLHHHDFYENDPDRAMTNLNSFRQLVSWLASQADVRFRTLSQVAAGFGPQDCLRRLRSWGWKTRLHWRVRRLIPELCYTTHPIQEVLACVGRHNHLATL